MRLAALAFAALSPSPLPAGAQADERILSYDSDVAVQRDGALRCHRDDHGPRRGRRDPPRHLSRLPDHATKGQPGGAVRVGFELLDVTRNGSTEPAATEGISNGVRVRIGSATAMSSPGDYRYVIRYRTTRQLGRFEDFDELYWNVTGNGWDFPIDRAEARITLPSPAPFGQRAVYTGPQGATGQHGAGRRRKGPARSSSGPPRRSAPTKD